MTMFSELGKAGGNGPQGRGDGLLPCWSCKGPVSMRALFCSTCGAVQGPAPLDHFARLGMAPGYALDVSALEKQYFGFQRRLHPDRFATRAGKEKALSQQQATALNEAYETLKDPLLRAAYLLKLKGSPIDLDGARTISDPALLMEAMEMREELAEADSREAVTAIMAKTEANVKACQESIAQAFAQDDLAQAGALTTRLKYLTKLADEARSRRVRLR